MNLSQAIHSQAKRAGRALWKRTLGVGNRLAGGAPIVSRAPHRPDAVALTFDDGPSEWSLTIAEALEAHGCLGTFFLLGANVAARPATVARLAQGGHELGNHLWSHSDPERQNRAALRMEIERAAHAIQAAGGERPRLLRPPYCGAPYAVARAAARTAPKPLVVLRSVDPADWRAESAEAIVEHVLTRIQPGDIVCLHDGIAPANRGTRSRDMTARAVALLVPALLARNLRPVTVSELLA